ncbi:rhomboid family intramembrane serine protease [Kutzneria albida]|uniref:Rhomboid-like protein n=1 Tax=Kutzneria albida DSM 43870 TaxID=1449976 RepID=W5VXU6_9PSEU|nr:rhomboid family intramembrane serine protease [Kutzneria albida]AHH93392.1 rhomboid-like protein [Kutzneria albida DSM 43870]
MTDPSTGLPGCVRHPDRPTALRCTRCERPACPACLRDAAVGQQCVDCVNEGRTAVRQPTTVAGARLRGQAVLVPALIVVNLALFAVTAYQAQSIANNARSDLFQDWAMAPGLVAFTGEWWRLLTAGFMHIGPLHLAVNMVSLWLIGRDLERLLGPVRFFALYFLSMVGGNLAVFLFGELGQPVAGASTALYGLMGCYLVAIVRLKLDPRPILITLGINVFITFTVTNISILGHFGGLVAGVLASAAIFYAPARNRNQWQTGTLLALTVLLIALFVTRDQQLVSLIQSGA